MFSLSTCLSEKKFCILVEYLSSMQPSLAVKSEFSGYPCMMTLADRVHSDTDLAPLDAAQLYSQEIEKLIHFSGKDRDITDFEQFLMDAKSAGQHNLLLLTGDRLRHHQSGSQQPRTRYLESVNAIMAAKKIGGFNIGVAFNPFKYTEAEKDAQYYKLQKKIKAGADFVITQLGYDLAALQQIRDFLQQHHYNQSVLACVMPLTLARANFMLKNKVAGIVITPAMLQVLAQEHQAGLSDPVYQRCALQILICQHMGFAGVHLSACHQPTEQMRLEAYIEEYRQLDFAACMQLWNDLWQVKTGLEFKPKLQIYSQAASSSQIIKYQHLHAMHAVLFQSKWAKGMGAFIFKANFWKTSAGAKALLKTELLTKHNVVGCESCGLCRLADTLYICPETCPKGLANGPCGGTTLDRCEFGDRECIHSVKARLAKAVQQTKVLQTTLIETVPIQIRGSSSWKNWFIEGQS